MVVVILFLLYSLAAHVHGMQNDISLQKIINELSELKTRQDLCDAELKMRQNTCDAEVLELKAVVGKLEKEMLEIRESMVLIEMNFIHFLFQIMLKMKSLINIIK